MKRRHGLILLGALASPGVQAWLPAPDPVRRGRPVQFPRDHGAHPAAQIEWWYATGWLGRPEAPTHGFQITFFRSRTGLAETNDSRFAARQLLFAHAAITDLVRREHRHDQRIVRWNGQTSDAGGSASTGDMALSIGNWTLRREGGAGPDASSRYLAEVGTGSRIAMSLALSPSQAPLLQGDDGFSRKGPEEAQASHYYSEPQLRAGGRVGGPALEGTAWLDHEWSDQLLHPDAVGWDWIGINLFDGSALTAFRLRRADGSALWAGGSFRPRGGAARAFRADEVRWTAARRWTSAATAASYPVQWQVVTPAGQHEVRALMDAQELDSRTGTGSVYWEGVSELLDGAGRRVGLGYLEMTGYAGRLRL